MTPCNEPRMSDPAWRAFLASHPHWHAPATAPCGGAAVRTWLRRVAIGLGAGIGAVGIGAGVAPIVGGAWPASSAGIGILHVPASVPLFVSASAGVGFADTAPAGALVGGAAPVAVPEPSSLGLMPIAISMLVIAVLVARRRA